MVMPKLDAEAESKAHKSSKRAMAGMIVAF